MGVRSELVDQNSPKSNNKPVEMTRKQVQTSLGTWAKEAELGLAIESTQKSSLQACQASPLAGNVVWPGRWRPRLQVVNMQTHFHLVSCRLSFSGRTIRITTS